MAFTNSVSTSRCIHKFINPLTSSSEHQGIAGHMVFEEELWLRWCFGALCLTIGICLISASGRINLLTSSSEDAGHCRTHDVRGEAATALVSGCNLSHHRNASHFSRQTHISRSAIRYDISCRFPDHQAQQPRGLASHVSAQPCHISVPSRRKNAVLGLTAASAWFGPVTAFCSGSQTKPSPIEIDRKPFLNFKAVIAYDGTHFSGFQLQAGQPQSQTIQGRLEKALTTVTLQPRQVLTPDLSDYTYPL